METIDVHDEIVKCGKRLREALSGLGSIQAGAKLLGFTFIADRMSINMDEIRDVADTLHRLNGQIVSNSFKTAQQASGNILHTALAVCELKGKEQDYG